MIRFFLLLAFLFNSQTTFSQLFVGPTAQKQDNFLFVKGSVLFVSDHVHLNKNFNDDTEASLYLRREGQLIQGNNQSSPNTGNGLLSVFQIGSANAYNYNYWAAPVGNSSGKNGLFGINMLHVPHTETASSPAGITSSLDGTAKPLQISNRWIYTFSGHSYSNWHFEGSETSIQPGHGFSMKGVNGTDPTLVEDRVNNPGNAQRYDFRGRPNSGTIEIPVPPNDFVLIGNPYPSSLDLSLFLLQNSGSGTFNTECYGQVTRRNATTGIAYFWDSDENGNSHYLQDYIGGYGTFSPVAPCTSGLYEAPLFKSYNSEEKLSGQKGKQFDPRYLPIAQGFMVMGTEGNPVVFENSQRVFVPQKTEAGSKSSEVQSSNKNREGVATIPNLKLQVEINEEYIRGLTLGFWPTATAEVDEGMDALVYDLSYTDAGWLLNEESYVINVRPFNIMEEIPLYLKIEHHQSKFIFTAFHMQDVQTENIFILDRQTNTYHSILKEPFEIILDPGNYHGRFNLAFMKKVNEAELPENLITGNAEPGSTIFQNNRLGELEIISDSFAPARSVGLYDLQGKRIFFRSTFSNRRSISISTKHLASGVYVVRVTDMHNNQRSRKIIVLNPS